MSDERTPAKHMAFSGLCTVYGLGGGGGATEGAKPLSLALIGLCPIWKGWGGDRKGNTMTKTTTRAMEVREG